MTARRALAIAALAAWVGLPSSATAQQSAPAGGDPNAAAAAPAPRLTPRVAPGAVGICVIQLDALRASPDVARVLDGIEPAALWPELAGSLEGSGAAAIPEGAIALSWSSWDAASPSLLASASLSVSAVPDAWTERLDAWAPRGGDANTPRWTHAGGTTVARQPDGVWLAGAGPVVDATLAAAADDTAVTALVEGPTALAVCGASVGTDAPANAAAWFRHVGVEVTLQAGLVATAEFTTQPGRAPELVAELERTLLPALASPQLTARLPFSLPPPTLAADGDVVRLVIRLEGDAWTALVDSARAALQSEL